ncbi:sodium-coupled monocarboxylate transporter 2-like isoform X2 [Rhodnius prolixus]|uniref:sodium-coupled monocarboxylate transporter 2-like isoform X2 n=1 Tax=Rhodnius prolixus TaxID=13249 RepID=UPI003D1886D7
MMSEIKLRRFDTLDYLIFTTMLVLSALTGLYFARGGQKTISSYLFGDKKLSLLPVSFSLVTTFVSGTFLLGVPTEIYLNGIQFIYSTFLSFFAIIFMVYLIIPVLYNLQLISLFEYMELRFNRAVRLILSFVYILQGMMNIPIVIYGPTLALNQVTGLNMQIIPPLVCLVCILYTTIGGLKAVVWTDTLQAIVILASVISVIILGLQRVGGVSQMIQIGLKGDRIEWLDMTLDPKIRITFWSLLFGSNFLTLSQYGTNPAAFQRYLSMPDLKKAQRSVFFLYFGMSFSLFLTAIIGLILYAAYRGCDPVSTKEIKRADQLFPFFVMEISENLKGVPGLFLAGIVGAALSTMSTTINTITGTIYKDFLEPFVFPKTNDAKASLIMKVTAVVIGIICTSSVFIVDKLGSIFEATLILYNAIGGVITGIFLLGLFVPFANSYGALTGATLATLVMGWISVGAFSAMSQRLVKSSTKTLSTELCTNATLLVKNAKKSAVSGDAVFPLYRISIFYYSLLGCSIVIIVGIIVSLLTKKKSKKVDPAFLSPLVRNFVDFTKDNEAETVILNTQEEYKNN